MASVPAPVLRLDVSKGVTADLLQGLHEGLRHHAEEHAISGKLRVLLLMVAEELCTNVAEHGDAHFIELALEDRGDRVKVRIIDDGTAFDMKDAVRRHSGVDLEKVEHRGLGLYLVGQLARSLTWVRQGNINTVEFEIHVEPEARP